MRKPVFGVSDQVPHKPGCTTTQDDKRLEISEVEGLYYPSSENKGADQLRGYREDQLRGYREADLRLGFRHRRLKFYFGLNIIGFTVVYIAITL